MAQLIVQVRPPPATQDAILESRRYQPGHVVDILEDGQHPGTDVLSLGWWRVVQVPGPASDYRDYLASDPEFELPTPLTLSKSTLPRVRLKSLDIATLTAQVEAMQGKPLMTSDPLSLQKADAIAATVTSVAIANPLVLADDTPILNP